MRDFLLGVATIPAVAALAYLAYIAFHWIDHLWMDWKPATFEQRRNRLTAATGIMLARRYFHIPLPGGVMLVYKSKIAADVPTFLVRQALDDTMREWEAGRDA